MTFAPIRQSFLALALLVSVVGVAQGQRPQTREGFWFGFGLGYGSFGCEDCNDREGGVAAYIKLGGTVSRTVLLGFEANAWGRKEGDISITQSHGSAVIYFYPSVTGGFHLKGGLGYAISRLHEDLGGGFSFDDTEYGGGILLGLGYDARIGRNLSLVPHFNFLGASFDGAKSNFIQVGLGLTFH
jgi:hypothetical protein